MGQSKSASHNRSGLGTRTAPALLVNVIRPVLVAAACLAQAGAFDAAGSDCDCATQATSGGAGPTDIALERWGAFLLGQPFDGVHEAGPAGAVASRGTRLDLPFPCASGGAAHPAPPHSRDSAERVSEPARDPGAALAEATLRPVSTDGVRGRLAPAEAVHPPSPSRPTAPMQRPWGAISELRGGVLNHDVIFPNRGSLRMPNPFRQRAEGGVNLNGELIFVAPGFLRYLGSPRPRLGGSINARDYTDNAYFDLDWDHQFTAGPFVEGYLGLAWHDGKLRSGNPERLQLGLRVLFHLGLEAGWRFYRHHGLSLMWEHMSNGTLARRNNQGVDSIGVRYSYRFDVQ